MANLPSTQFTLKVRDFLKAALLAVVVPVLVVVQASLSAGELTFNWKQIGTVALSAFVAYLAKNFLTNDVPVAEKTIQEAQTKQIEKMNS